MALKSTFAKLGKDILKAAFPDVYNGSNKFRAVSNTAPTRVDPNAPPLIQAVTNLDSSTRFSNEIASDALQALLVQNELLSRIAKGGLGGEKSWLDTIEDALSGAKPPTIRGKPGASPKNAAKPKAKAVRDPKTGRYTKAPTAKVSKAGKLVRIGGKLLRIAPVIGGAVDAYEEYSESGNVAKAGTVGVGSTLGAYGGAAAGALVGSAIMPGIGTLAGAIIGGIAGGYGGNKLAGAGYDALTASNTVGGSVAIGNLTYNIFDTITFKANEIQLNGQEIIGLGGSTTGRTGGTAKPYAGFFNSLADKAMGNGAGSVNTLADKYTSVGRAREQVTGGGSGGRTHDGPVGPTANRGDVPGRPKLEGNLAESLPAGKERFFHQQGNVAGVDERLVSTLKASSKDLPPGFRMEMISGKDARATGTKNHPGGVAVDVKIYDDKGRLVPHNGNSPGWKYYEQTYKSVQERGKAMYPGSNWIWGGAWVSGAAGPGDPMHYQIGSNVPGASTSSGMYDPNTGFDNNTGINSGINFKANAMTKEEREAYVKQVRENIAKEKAGGDTKPEPEKRPDPVTAGYNVDMAKVIKTVREKKNVPGFISDDYIKGQVIDRVKQDHPNLEYKDGKLTGPQADIDKLQSGMKDQLGLKPDEFMKPMQFSGLLGGKSADIAPTDSQEASRFPDFRRTEIDDRRTNSQIFEYASGYWSQFKKDLPSLSSLRDAWENPFMTADDLARLRTPIIPDPTPLGIDLGAGDLDRQAMGEEREVPGPLAQNTEVQRLRNERDRLKKQVKRLKASGQEAEDSGDDSQNEQPDDRQVQDNTRSDRALWNINPQLHQDEHPQ